MKTANVIDKINLNNREFILSSEVRPCGKVGFYAHELGALTQWSKLFGGEERLAHRINPSMRVKGKHWISRPYNTQDEALKAIETHSKLNVQYF